MTYMDKIINKQIFLPKHFINVTTFIDIFVRDEFAITIPERTEEEYLEMMANGYTKKIQQCIEAYEKSPLPERFLKSQAFIVTNALPRAVYGFYAIDGNIY